MALTTGNFLSDSGAPDPEVGVDGDHYRNTANEDVYFKASSIWSLIGNLGSGADGVGSTILDDDGEPGGELGSDGFYYIDRISLNLWKKVSGIWDLIGGLVGAPTPGTLISRGTVVPDDGFGVDGYYYFRIDTGDLYHKEGGSWTLEGSWLATPTPASSIFLAGPGAPADILGENDNYYRDTDTQDIYQKQADSWVQIGNWLGGGGGSSGPFEVGTWDMTGAISPAVPGATVLSATLGGTAPAYTLTPDATLTGAGPIYWAAAESVSGLPVSGTDTLWADFTKPDYIGGDNLFVVGFAIVNESATIADVIASFMDDPVTGVWGAILFSSHQGPGAYSIGTRIITNGVGGSTRMDNDVNATGGSNIGGGIDFTTMTLVYQRDGGTVNVGSALDLTGMPLGETFKIVHLLAFTGSSTVSFADGSLTYTPSSEAFGRTGFGAPGSAIPPMGAQDGDVFEVTAPGSFGGSTTQVGDFAQLYDNESKIIVTRVADVTAAEVAADLGAAVTALEGADTALDGRLDTAESSLTDHGTRIGNLEGVVGTRSSLGALAVEEINIPAEHTVTPFNLTCVGEIGAIRQLVIPEDGTRINLDTASGDVPSRFLVQFKGSIGLGAEARVVFDYSNNAGGPIIIPAKDFLKCVIEVIFDGTGGWKTTVIPLEDQMHIRVLGTDSLTDFNRRNGSTPYQVLDITGAGTAGAVAAAIPNPWQFQGGEVLVSLIGGAGDSITDLVLSNPIISGSLAQITLNATGPFVPGDSFSIKARRTMVGGFPKWVYSAQKLSSNA